MSFEPQHIVVPVAVETDEEFALAEYAAQAAFDIAKAVGARLTLLYVGPNLNFAEATYPGLQVQAYQSLRDILEQRVAHARERLHALWSGLEGGSVHVEAHLVTNHTDSVPKAICSEATVLEADLIVLCSHGRLGISRALLGSVAERVAHLASVPVLLLRVPEEA